MSQVFGGWIHTVKSDAENAQAECCEADYVFEDSGGYEQTVCCTRPDGHDGRHSGQFDWSV